MKSFLQNLLIFFALALCALIAYQWVRETDLRKNLQARTDEIHDKSETIQNLQGNVKRDEAEIQRLDGLKTQLTQTVKSNDVRIAGLGKDLDKATNALDHAEKQVGVYKDAVERANDSIKTQNETIKSQNDEMKKMAEDRNVLVQKYNKMAADYNDLAKKWNEQQEMLAKQATNNPAKK
jgi:chromosome segregation ATPase